MGDSSMIQINWCGISIHAKTELERNFYVNKLKIVALKETRQNLDRKHFH